MSKPLKQRAPKGSHISQNAPDTTITDPRFSNIHTDPRFRLPSKKHTHVQLDKRFSYMLRDEDFSKKAAVDRYGRKLPSDSGRKELERFYRIEDEDEGIAGDDVDHDEKVAKELRRVERDYDPARQGGFSSSSDDTSSDEGDVEELKDAEDTEIFGFPDQQPDQETGVPMGEISPRIAVVNLDWDNIRAADLMAVFSSFVPSSGRILKVSIYPSEFGRERMEREETEGPPKEIFTTAQGREEDTSSGSEEDVEDEDEDEDERIKKSILQEDKGEEFDSAKLRRYQLERLRYYYAVLSCSSSGVAKHIYDAVDGTEYLTTANFFDLRFIPDDVDFSDDKLSDECERIPDGYRPNDFVTDALQHSKVRLTWDADDGARKEVQRRAFAGSRAEIDENDLKAYLGSESSDDEGPEATVVDASTMTTPSGTGVGDEDGTTLPKATKKERERQRMRSLLGLGEGSAPSKKSKAAAGGPVGDMQITFSSGLSAAPKDRSVFENEPERVESTVEKYVRKEKERKTRRKEKMKGTRNGDATASNDADGAVDAEVNGETPQGDLGFEDPFFTAPADDKVANAALRKAETRMKREQRAADEAASAVKRAELELLMVDDKTSDVKHFDMNEIRKAEKAARKKNKKRNPAAEIEGEKERSGFEMDVQDPRFRRLFESHEFAIDPTNPRFRGTEGMKALLEEGRRKRQRGEEDGDDVADKKLNRKAKKAKAPTIGDEAMGGDDLQTLVERVKGKIKS